MKRRDLLSTVVAIGTATVAGCLSQPPGNGGGGTGDDDQTDESPSTDSPDAGEEGTATPSLSDSSFTVTKVASGQGENVASVALDEGVTVTGTIGGNNGCYTAELQSADVSGGTLTVVVRAFEEKADDEMCTQALVDVDYEATFSFAGVLPDQVVVKHDSLGEVQTVADATC